MASGGVTSRWPRNRYGAEIEPSSRTIRMTTARGRGPRSYVLLSTVRKVPRGAAHRRQAGPVHYECTSSALKVHWKRAPDLRKCTSAFDFPDPRKTNPPLARVRVIH